MFVGLIAALIASFFISNGSGFQIWVLLAFGPMLLRLAKRQEDPVEVRPAPAPAAAGPAARHSPGAGLAGLKRAITLRCSASMSLGRGTMSFGPAPSLRPKMIAAASPPSV